MSGSTVDNDGRADGGNTTELLVVGSSHFNEIFELLLGDT